MASPKPRIKRYSMEWVVEYKCLLYPCRDLKDAFDWAAQLIFREIGVEYGMA
jgi:hypothetical protein